MVEIETKAESTNDVCERLTEDLGNQNTESINTVKPGEICSKERAAEEGHVVEDETMAENSKNVHERLAEELGQQIMVSVNSVKPSEIFSK